MAIPSAASSAHGITESPRASWRAAMPTIETRSALLREVAPCDAASLALAVGNAEVLKYLSPGPTTPEHFSRFIEWVKGERRAGRYICFAVVPRGFGTAQGLFQLWPVEPGFGTAEMGFALNPALWGTSIFLDCATAIVDFAVDTLAVRRLEFRSATSNGRGTGALSKLGAVREGTLRRCFECSSGILDHTMWSILADEWRARNNGWRAR